MDLKSDNIVADLNLILINIPRDKSPLEQARWLYIKVGNLFSYNYAVAYNIELATKEIDFENNYIDRYQTCIQIAYILNLMLNEIPGITANIIKRKLNVRGIGNVGMPHSANEIILENGDKYILDLTLDLYLIQAGYQTKEFGYTTNKDGDYSIISLRECENMDKNLGLLKFEGYSDKKLYDKKLLLTEYDYSKMNPLEIIDFKLKHIKELIYHYKGHHEGKLLINKLFLELLNMQYKEFNITYENDSSGKIITCFVIQNQGYERWVLYSDLYGLEITEKENIQHMITNGWTTKSDTLKKIFNIKTM